MSAQNQRRYRGHPRRRWQDGRMERSARTRRIWLAGLAVAVLGLLGIWAFWGSLDSSGDPGGKVMDQLTPTVTAVPGYGTSALPWVSQIPQSLDASYAIKMEPFQDSCDGRAGTQGWSQVVVQSKFQWSQGLQALADYMGPRLAKFGWTAAHQHLSSGPPATLVVQSGIWTKTLDNGTRAQLSIIQEGGTPGSWMPLETPPERQQADADSVPNGWMSRRSHCAGRTPGVPQFIESGTPCWRWRGWCHPAVLR